jgi:hypothetical protein
MFSGLSVPEHRQTASKRIAVCFGCVFVSFLAVVSFGFHRRLQGPKNILADRRISPVPAEIQPKLVASYGKLPLSFQANQGQADARVRFLARGGGYTIFLTDDEAVLTLRKSQPGMSRFGKLGFPGPLDPFGPVDLRAGRGRGVADDWKSLWRSLIPDFGQLVPEPNAGRGGDAVGPEPPPPQVVRMRLMGGKARGGIVGLDELPGRSNYFIGNDRKKWRTNVPSYAQVKYEGVYPGVDLVYYGNQRQLEYDFVVAPGADPNQIKLGFAGADGMRVDAASGDLVLKVGDDEVRLHKPAVYQPVVARVFRPAGSETGADVRVRSTLAKPNPEHPIPSPAALSATFVLASNNVAAFRLAGYDPKRALVIDPVLSYSTYLGGSGGDIGQGIAVDSSGNAYVTGNTYSTDFPTVNPLQPTNKTGPDMGTAFVAKLNSAGSALVYSTYLGGSGRDDGSGIAVDSSGSVYVTGQTSSTDFPTVNPLQATNNSGPNDGTGFVAKLNPTGSALVYSTYLGGSQVDRPTGIGVDSSGRAALAGYTYSTDFPTVNPLQATNNSARNSGTGFVAKLNAAGSALVYSTYLGGSGLIGDGAYGIAEDSSGNVYLTGRTSSSDFPTVNALQAVNKTENNSNTAFVAELNPAGSALIYSTFLGGSYRDQGNAIAVDSSGDAYVTGQTWSNDFPTLGPLQGTNRAAVDTAFIAKLSAAGSALVYSTFLGGSYNDQGNAIAVDSSGDAYVTGQTWSSDFPVTAGAYPITLGTTCGAVPCNHAFVSVLNASGSALLYSTYLGGNRDDSGAGIAVDSYGHACVTGSTTSTDFPAISALQPTYNGGEDAFVAKFSAGPGANLSGSSLAFGGQTVNTTSAEQSVTLTNSGDASLTISGIATSANFGQTNNCAGSVAPSGSCTISVTFSPTTAGPLTGTLTITDNSNGVAGTTQSVALSGTGQDFTLAASSGSSTSATVAPGSTATYTLSVAGEGGFNQSVSFSCTGAPSEVTCTVSPSTVTPGSSATNITVSVTTTAPSVGAPRSRPLPPAPLLSPDLRGLLMLALALAAMAWAIMRRNLRGVSRWRSTLVPLAWGLLLTLTLAGCGGGGSSVSMPPPNPGTPAGTYTLTVTGSTGSGSSALSHSLTLTLNVS